MTWVLLLLSLFFPLLTIPIVVWYSSKQHKVLACSIIIGIACGLVAYSVDVSVYGDLARYIISADTYSNQTIDSIFTGAYSDYPLSACFFWLIANTAGASTLPFYMGLIIYGIMSYIVLDYCEHHGNNHWMTSLAILGMFCIISPFGSVSSVRSSLAVVLVVLAYYLEFYRGIGLIKAAIFYIASCFIHDLGLLLLLMRIVFTLTKSRFYIAAIIALFAIPLALYILTNFNFVGSLQDTSITGSLLGYTGEARGWAAEVLSSRFQYVLRILNLTLMISMGLICINELQNQQSKEQRFIECVLFGLLLSCGFAVFIASDVYLRLAYFYEALGLLIVINRTNRNTASDVQDLRILRFNILGTCIAINILGLFALYNFQLNASVDLLSFFKGLLFGITSILIKG